MVECVPGRNVGALYMDLPPPDFRLLRYSSDEHPVNQRIGVWTELAARKLLRVVIEPLTSQSFQVEASLRVLPGLRFGIATFTPSINRRTREIVAADNDDLFVLINLEGELTIAHGDAEYALGEGDACFMSCRQEGNFIRTTHGRVLCGRFERAKLSELVSDVDACSGRVVRRDSEALRLLSTYMKGLDHAQGLETEELRQRVVQHAYDLASIVLSRLSERDMTVRERGVSTGRFQAVKKYLDRNLERSDINLVDAAADLECSARQLQRLFEAEGTTFSLYLLGKRLARVHAALTDRRQGHRPISEIALANGFGDVSHFNRAFRRRYGLAPSDVRRGEAPAKA